ncbi:McrB family protein [Branchiibius cervicis]|uniref:McrB family protein n=1 Tax=Branchiibius cervicis TaxID=908252 RepID=A0ABW2AX31_9MICO
MTFPRLGEISLTKFTSPEHVLDVLRDVEPGSTTALELQTNLDAAGQPGPLWNDLAAYEPPLVSANVTADDDHLVVDNELLRAARTDRGDRFLLVWVALCLADARLDAITREILTDADGHLDPAVINAVKLRATLDQRSEGAQGAKATSNILSLLERCQLIVPNKYGGSTVGIAQVLPTANAVRGAVALVGERLADQGFEAVPDRAVDLAVSIGVNAWLNLSVEEFRSAYEASDNVTAQSHRDTLPDSLAELDAQLRRKGQVVLQGPPGAGKTYVATEYVEWATSNRLEDSRLQAIIDGLPTNQRNVTDIATEVERRGLTCVWDIVQFHPGYDYTDFVRALVAQPQGDGVSFVPRHRIFSLICAIGEELARRGHEADLVLILDEVNRGDIPNIFGELLYALEYRGQAVATPYAIDGDASLTVPSRLRVLGTMNTADRSIAVIDYALRRRFVFLDIAATAEPINAFAFDADLTRQAALHLYSITAAALSDAPSGLQVGPSYFLATPDGSESSLQVLSARYVYEVLPLLNEYEMEGELDPGIVSGLRNDLAILNGLAQRDQVTGLVHHLSGQPWVTAVTTDGEANDDAANDGPDGP